MLFRREFRLDNNNYDLYKTSKCFEVIKQTPRANWKADLVFQREPSMT